MAQCSGGGGGCSTWWVILLLPLSWCACAGATKYVAPRVADSSGVMLPMDACLWAPASAAELAAPQGNCGRAAAAYYCTISGTHVASFKLAPASGTTMRATEQDPDRQLCTSNCTTFEYIECSDVPAAGAAATFVDPRIGGALVDICLAHYYRWRTTENLLFGRCMEPQQAAAYWCQLQGFSEAANFSADGKAPKTQWLAASGQCTSVAGDCPFFTRIDCKGKLPDAPTPPALPPLPPPSPQPSAEKGPHGGTLWRSPQFGGLPLDACLWDPVQAPAASYDVQGNCGRAAALWFCLILKEEPYLLGFQTASTSAATIHPTERDDGKRMCTQGCTTFASIECGDQPLPAAGNTTTAIEAPRLNSLPITGCLLENLRYCWDPAASFYCQLQGHSGAARHDGEGVLTAQPLGLSSRQRCIGLDGKPTCVVFKRIECIPGPVNTGQASQPASNATAQASQPTGEPSSSSVPIGAIVGGVSAAAAIAAILAFFALRPGKGWLRRKPEVASGGGSPAGSTKLGGEDTQGSSLHAAELDGWPCTADTKLVLAPPTASQSASLHSHASDMLLSYIASVLASHPRPSPRSAGTSAGSSKLPASAAHWEVAWDELEVERAVGRGSFGWVYLARWRHTPVAVKILLNTDDTGAGSRLELPEATMRELHAEASVMAGLRHPQIVQFMGLCLLPPALVTEYCTRGSLYNVLREMRHDAAAAQHLTVARRLRMAVEAGRGLLYLHTRGVLHRDVKSPNLLVTEDLRVKAPEVLSGERTTVASDVYAFGIVLSELLTWRLPYDDSRGQSPFELGRDIRQGRRPEVPPPAELPGPGIATWAGLGPYCALMRECWAAQPGDRPSMDGVVARLQALAEQADA